MRLEGIFYHARISESEYNLLHRLIMIMSTHLQESITNTTSLMVMLVSAILVDRMICKRKNSSCEIQYICYCLFTPCTRDLSCTDNYIYVVSPMSKCPWMTYWPWWPPQELGQTRVSAPREESVSVTVESQTVCWLEFKWKEPYRKWPNIHVGSNAKINIDI